MADVAKIVVRRLATGKAKAVNPELHPDANLLTAFVERSLANGERSQVMDHLAQCSVCREVVTLAVPELVSTSVVSRPGATSWVSWPVLRWGVALACVLLVGAAVTLRQREASQVRSGEGKPAAVSATAVTNAPQETVQSAAAPAGESVAKAKTGEVREQRRAVQASIPGRAKDDLAQAQPPSASRGAAHGMNMARADVPATSSLSLKASPRMAPRWALAADDGTLQRSLDMGRSWEPVAVSVEASLRALAANGFDIWVGGTAGALYHSSDAGDHWMKVQPVSDGQPLTADIIGVEFSDSEHGRLNTASGEVWSTEDGGLSWRKQ